MENIYTTINNIQNWKEIRKDSNRVERHICDLVIRSGSFNEFASRLAMGTVPTVTLFTNLWVVLI